MTVMRKMILFLVTMVLVSCGSSPSELRGRAGTPAAHTRNRLPRGLTYEDVDTPAFRGILIESSTLEGHRGRGPGVTIAVEATFNNTSERELRPACWLAYGSQVRLFDVEETPVVPAKTWFTLKGLVRFPARLNANESDLIYCRPMRDDEVAPEDE